jgi:glycosyltransferase involved in cell wall biosynthesis
MQDASAYPPAYSRRPLRIAVVGMRGMPSNYSGIERVGEELYPALVERGHEVTVFARPGNSPADIADFRGVRVIRTGGISWPPLETLSQSLSTFRRAAQAHRFDLVHLHALAPALIAAGYRARRVPTILTVHGLDWQRARWKGLGSLVLKQAERCGVRFANEIIVVSTALQEYYRTSYGRATTVVHNALDFPESETAAHSPDLARYDLQPDQYILFVGRLVPEKRIDDAINAFRSLKTDCKLAIVGSGPRRYTEYLQSLAQPDRRVIFTGRLEQDEVRSLFKGAAAFVLPSELEGLPLSLIEGIGYGVPAIVSDIPPHRELLDSDGSNGLFFRVRDTTGLKMQFSRALSEREERRRVARDAQANLRARFSVKEMVNRTEQVFLRAAARH